jgi:putative glutamine amidotransferase
VHRDRPLIAVAAYRLEPGRVDRWPDGGYGVPAPYLDALRTAGARSAILPPGEVAEPDELLEPFDGLLLVGGGDVDPVRYGAQRGAHDYGVDPQRDAFEIALVHAADRAAIPTLCICRGAQVLNVAFGGTLYQHLPDVDGLLEHGVPLEGTTSMHDVETAQSSACSGIRRRPPAPIRHSSGCSTPSCGSRATGPSAPGRRSPQTRSPPTNVAATCRQ